MKPKTWQFTIMLSFWPYLNIQNNERKEEYKDKKDKNTQCKRTSSHPRQAAVFRNAGQGSHAGENVDGRQELFCNERLLTNACSTFTSLNRECLWKQAKIFWDQAKRTISFLIPAIFEPRINSWEVFFDALAIASESYESLQTGKSCFSSMCVYCDFQTNVIFMVTGLRTCNKSRAKENVRSKWHP